MKEMIIEEGYVTRIEWYL